MFNREIWPLESASVLRGQPVKLAAGGGEIRWESADAADLVEALDEGELKLHGNYMWGSGTQVYGAMLQADDAEKTRNVHLAAEVLNRSDIGPAEKAEELERIDGFGPNASTGLVMACHPTDFAIYNQPSRAIMKDMGYPTQTVAQFEQSAAALREQLGAEDFLELDLFLYIRSLRAKRDGTGKGGLAEFRDEYDAFARSGGTNPTWYQRYSMITRYLADVRQRLRSRPDRSSLRPEDIPALPEWDIAEGDVEGFLEMVWHSPDNGVSGLGRGRVADQYWESIKSFSRGGVGLADLTAAMIRDPEYEGAGRRRHRVV